MSYVTLRIVWSKLILSQRNHTQKVHYFRLSSVSNLTPHRVLLYLLSSFLYHFNQQFRRRLLDASSCFLYSFDASWSPQFVPPQLLTLVGCKFQTRSFVTKIITRGSPRTASALSVSLFTQKLFAKSSLCDCSLFLKKAFLKEKHHFDSFESIILDSKLN